MNNLVILPIGSKSLLNQWGNDRNFDLWTFNFDGSNIYDYYSDRKFDIRKFKYHAIKELITSEDISKYEYFWFPDDDLMISTEDVNIMFDIIRENELLFGQLSVSSDWHLTYHYYLRTNPKFKFRKTNFIEVMCPFFHKDFLSECIDTFDINNSSYGIDVEWSFRADPTKTAIIDKVNVKHIRKVYNGDLYTKLKSMNISEVDEMMVIFNKYGLRNGVADFLWVEGGYNF